MMLTIFVSAFLSSCLGCVQAINVVRGHRVASFATSIGIALCQLTVLKLIPSTSSPGDLGAFIIGGVLGSQAAIVIKGSSKPPSCT